MHLSVVIPLYNEEKNIKPLTCDIISILDNINIKYEITLINDASLDDTLKEINTLKTKYPNLVNIINNSKNLGQSYSLISGIQLSKYNDVLTLDGDGQNDPKDIPNLIKKYSENKKVDFVGGIRKKRRDTYLKIISSKIANHIRKFILNDDCLDTGCSLKIFKKDIFLIFPKFKGLHRFLPALFKGYGFKTMFVEVNHRKRNYGSSNYGTFSRLIYGIVDIIRVLYYIKRFKNAKLHRKS